MSTEIMRIRGHHLLPEMFIWGLEYYRKQKLNNSSLNLENYFRGEQFRDRFERLETRLDTEPGLFVRLVAGEPDWLCEVCPSPYNAPHCFDDNARHVDLKRLRKLGLKLGRLYTTQELKETVKVKWDYTISLLPL